MSAYWAKTIPARFFSRVACGALALLLAAGAGRAQPLESLAQAFHLQRTPANQAALERFAAAHPKDQEGALALLALAVAEREQGRSADALRHLSLAPTRLARLADYIGYYRAAAQFDVGNFGASVQDLEAVWKANPRSPLVGDAALLAARAQRESGKPAEAVAVLRANYALLPQPAGDLLLATCYRAANDLTSAVVYYQRVFYGYPATGDAEQAGLALGELKHELGALFPPPTTQAMFQRAERWLHAGDRQRARARIHSHRRAGRRVDRELARVRLAEIDYFRYENLVAYGNLKALQLSSEEADAERLYDMPECARRLEREDQIRDAIDRSAQAHPRSPWRLKALVSAGNRYLVENRRSFTSRSIAPATSPFRRIRRPLIATGKWSGGSISSGARMPRTGSAITC